MYTSYNMNAEDKAKDILKRVFDTQHTDDSAKLIIISTFEIALIIIEEIINALYDKGQNADYWYDVKTEIEKLKDA